MGQGVFERIETLFVNFSCKTQIICYITLVYQRLFFTTVPFSSLFNTLKYLMFSLSCLSPKYQVIPLDVMSSGFTSCLFYVFFSFVCVFFFSS